MPRAPAGVRVASFRRALLGWFGQCGRNFPWRSARSTEYERIVSEVLLQRTRAETVAAFYPAFFAAFPTWDLLAGASEGRLRHFLKPLGLWRRRASALRRLSAAAVEIGGRFPSCRDALEDIPGVGQYVASAILLFQHGIPAPLLDVNMARVLERYFGRRRLADIRWDPYLQALALMVVKSSRSKEVNWAFLDFGALVCKAHNPACVSCVLRSGCKRDGVVIE